MAAVARPIVAQADRYPVKKPIELAKNFQFATEAPDAFNFVQPVQPARLHALAKVEHPSEKAHQEPKTKQLGVSRGQPQRRPVKYGLAPRRQESCLFLKATIKLRSLAKEAVFCRQLALFVPG